MDAIFDANIINLLSALRPFLNDLGLVYLDAAVSFNNLIASRGNPAPKDIANLLAAIRPTADQSIDLPSSGSYTGLAQRELDLIEAVKIYATPTGRKLLDAFTSFVRILTVPPGSKVDEQDIATILALRPQKREGV